MANKKKPSKIKLKPNLESHGKSKSVINNIYTYSNKKPKRLGKTCVHFNADKLTCILTGVFCKGADNCIHYVTNLQQIKNLNKTKVSNKGIVGVTTIVLSDNRKCTNNKHNIIDLRAAIRIADSNGKISIMHLPLAYCKECGTYFILKKDYKIAKSKGVILCPIIDLTKQSNIKNKNKNISSSESRIHQLGYNVQRGNGYTIKQRQLILANILENTNISKHEIESCILRPMSQHRNQLNYSDAVLAWQEDLEFIKSYKLGDLPEVIINKVIIGKRSNKA